MHALVEDILPYLVVFYLVDSLVLVRASEWVLVAPWRRFRTERSGLHLVGLSPLAEVVGLFVPPVLAGRKAILILDTAGPVAGLESRVPFDASVAIAVDGKTVRLGDRRLATPSAATARRWAATLRGLVGDSSRDQPGPARDARSDLERARERRAVQLRLGPWVRGLGLALFVVTFGLLPASLAWEGGPGPGPVLLALLALHGTIVVLAWRMLRRCGMASEHVTSAVAPMLLFPPSAIHAWSHLSRDLYLDLDPLAVTAALLDGEALRDVARRLVHRGERLRGLGEEAAEGVEAQRAAWRKTLKAAGTSLDQALEAPVSSDPSAAFYCPLCVAEYRAGFTTCSDCGIPLRRLAPAAGSPPVLLEA